MRLLIVGILIATSATVVAGALGEDPQSLLVLGAFHGSEIRVKSGETWIGLFKNGDGFLLRHTRIRVSPVHDPIVDESEEHRTGKQVSIDGEGEPIFLFASRLSLVEGPVAVIHSEEEPLDFRAPKSLSLQKEDYYLALILESTDVPSLGCQIVLRHGSTSQVLESQKECDPDKWPSLLWAGDLDHDGKLDLIIDQTNHYNVTALALYLSSKARKGDLVAPAGYLHTVGC